MKVEAPVQTRRPATSQTEMPIKGEGTWRETWEGAEKMPEPIWRERIRAREGRRVKCGFGVGSSEWVERLREARVADEVVGRDGEERAASSCIDFWGAEGSEERRWWVVVGDGDRERIVADAVESACDG